MSDLFSELSDPQPDDDTDKDKFDIEKDDLELDRIANPFDPKDIKVSRRITSIEQVVKRISYNEIDLAPDFQRRARIWDKVRKSRLIESILLRIPLPVFYVASDFEENWRVVDGLQRLTTIYDYKSGDKRDKFRLSGLEYLKELDGRFYEELPRGLQRRIDETELNINIIENGTPDRVMFNIFSRLNTGGITLNKQEIRHALNPGPARDFLAQLANDEWFQEATSRSLDDKRMGAREIILRFIAFFLTPPEKYVSGDLDGFLNEAMHKLNNMSQTDRNHLQYVFQLSMYRAYHLFKDSAFRKPATPTRRKSPINKALFEAISVNLAKIDEEHFSTLMLIQPSIKEEYNNMLINDDDFITSISISTGNKSRVITRFNKTEQIFSLSAT